MGILEIVSYLLNVSWNIFQIFLAIAVVSSAIGVIILTIKVIFNAEHIWQKILLAFFYVVLFPFYAVICIRDSFRIISLYTKYMLRSAFCGYIKYGILKKLSEKYPNVLDVQQPSTLSRLDFDIHRTPVWVHSNCRPNFFL